VWLRNRIEARRRQTFKSLPFMLDLIETIGTPSRTLASMNTEVMLANKTR